MNNELSVWASTPNPMDAVLKYGEIIAKAKFFGCANPEQGQALVLMAMGENIPITEMRKRYHIIGGNLSMRADFMRAEFDRQGGVLTWLDQGDDGQQAVVRVKYKHHDLEVKYTIEDAKREGLVKPGSRWVTGPGDMLRARVSTKAIRMVCPGVLCGFASDDELRASDPDADAIDAEATTVPAAVAAVRNAAGISKAAEKVEAVEAEPMATGEQIARLTELFKELKIDAGRQLTAIQKRGAKDMGDLSAAGAADMIASFEAKLPKADTEQQQAAAEHEEAIADATPVATALASPEQIEQVKQLLRFVAQKEGMADVGGKVKQKMASSAITKLAEMTAADVQLLIDCLDKEDLGPFLSASLESPTAPF